MTPPSSPTEAVISGFTRIAPEAIASKASGYSPQIAQLTQDIEFAGDHDLQGQRDRRREIADQHHAAALPHRADREIDGRRGTDDFHGHVHFGNRRGSADDGLIRAEFAGKLQAAFIEIHGDDRGPLRRA